MHSLLVAFFAMVFSFSHGPAVHNNQPFLSANIHPIYNSHIPTREELAQQQFETATSYAENSCVSCRRMNTDSSAR